MKLLVVRHGETDFNKEHRINGQFNSNLTPVGIQESEICGGYLRKLHFDKVLVSDLGRTVKTLQCFEILGDKEVRLRDRNFGPYNGELYASYVRAKHEERQRLCNGSGDIEGQYSVPSASSSCVLSYSFPGVTSDLKNGHMNGHKVTNGHGHESRSRDNAYYREMLSEIEPAGVERYEDLFLRIEDLIHDTMYQISEELSKEKQTAKVLFVTHCSPVRMCAMVLSSYSSDQFPKDLRKFNIPNNSISEYKITVCDETHRIDRVELIRLASTKHLHV